MVAGKSELRVPARNMGEVKGLTYDRVLIGPTGPFANYFKSGGELAPVSRSKLCVAVTRARQSAAIVMDKPGSSLIPYWEPS